MSLTRYILRDLFPTRRRKSKQIYLSHFQS